MIQAVKKGHLITVTQTSKFFYLFLKSIRTLLKIRKRIQLLACKKKQAWKDVTELYNSNVLQARNSEQLQQLWRN